MPVSSRPVQKMHKDEDVTREMLIDEHQAVIDYHSASDRTTDGKAKEVYEHIAEEEENHVGMLEELLDDQSPESDDFREEGEEEAEDILDKMMVDMTSEQAWNDFKSQYIGKSANDTTLDAKLDTVMSAVQEMKVDIDRVTDTIPQMQGEIEEQKTLENESQGEDQIEEFGDDVSEDMTDEEQSDFDSLFGDMGGEDGEAEDGEGTADDDTEDGSPYSDLIDDEDSEDSEDGEEMGEDEEKKPIELEDTEAEGQTDEGEEDYTPIDEIMADDEESDDSTDEEESDEDADEEPSEDADASDEEEVVEEEEDDTEEILEKMVKAMSNMDARITALERENKALRKMMTVKNEPSVRKAQSRPQPTIRKTVAGSVNRPPIGISYSANGNLYQNDADGTVKGMPTPTIGKSSVEEVLAYCDSVAKNGM